MGDSQRSLAAAEVEVWLRAGGRVVAASERVALAVADDYHRARQADGLTAWVAPQVESWLEFVRNAWDAVGPKDDRLVMNPVQEQTVWARVIDGSPHAGSLLPGPLQRMAKMAANGHALLCAYAPECLKEGVRANWQRDAAAFSSWLTDFDQRCNSGRLVSAARLPVELLSFLQTDRAERQPLLLVGFDRLQPIQERLLKGWGTWRQCELTETAVQSHFYEAPDEQSELKACALWCKDKLEQNRKARLMVMTQDLPKRRGEFERTFLIEVDGTGAQVEFSLGVPVGQTSLVRAAYLLMQWLAGSVEEHELDWLLGCGQLVESAAETDALTGFMRALRRRGQERTHWRCDEFMSQSTGLQLPAGWVAQIVDAKRRLDEVARKSQSPMAWAEFVPDLLRSAGWPGKQVLTSEQFQTLRRWEQVLDTCASLGFDGRRMTWREFLETIREMIAETLFAPESRDASVLITGPAESAGLAADAIWFMGASEDAWPAASSAHPLIPFWVQRDSRMPHATLQVDLDQAQTVTARLWASAPELCFSYARQVSGVEMRASKLAALKGGEPEALQKELASNPNPGLEAFEDSRNVPLVSHRISGGSAVLNSQSQCPFKAFASTRLGAEGWNSAEAGLTAMQRGNLLHEVMHSVWGPDGIRDLVGLKAIAPSDLRAFVNRHVRTVLEKEMPPGARERMPAAYLSLEEERLTNIASEWLEFERTRAEFTVEETEVEKEVTVAGLLLKLRLDRIDRLNDGSLLVVDYKTGIVNTNVWDLPRPEDVQLPLYAGFALDREKERPGGLVFAKLRKGEYGFAGKVRNAKETLIPSLSGNTSLMKKRLTPNELDDWRKYIETMANDFLAGRADVDPIDRNRTCERCGMQTLCRISESEAEDSDNCEEEEADDE